MNERTVLLDLTPLDTPSRRRGPGRYLRELAQGLAALTPSELGGLRVLGLTHLNWDGTFRTTEDIASFTGSPELPSPTKRDHYHWAYSRRFGLWRALRALRPNVVHLGDPNATPLLTTLTASARVVTCHDAIPLRYPAHYFSVHDGGQKIGPWIEWRRYRTADLVVAISDASARDAVELLHVPPSKLVRVYNGVDVDTWAREPALEAPTLLARHHLTDAPYVLYVGGADWHKNIEGLFGGLAAARKRGVPLTLAWAASLPPAKLEEVNDKARAAGVEGGLRMLGYVPDEELSVLYRHAIAHVLVSRSEGFGLTIVEAMAAGCPIVATRGGSLAEIAGDAALEVPAEDHSAIGDALVRLAEAPKLRDELRAKGRARAPRFARAVQAREMVAVYQRAAARRG